MKNIEKYILWAIVYLFCSSVVIYGAGQPHIYKTTTGENIKFSYNVSGVRFSGKFLIEESQFKIDFNKNEKSSFFVKINLLESNAGFPLATAAMLGESVLNAEKHPFMEFKSNIIKKTDDGFVIAGVLKIRGVEKFVKLQAKPQKRIKNRKNHISFDLSAIINRFDFGASGFRFLVGKNINLNSEINLVLWDKNAKT